LAPITEEYTAQQQQQQQQRQLRTLIPTNNHNNLIQQQILHTGPSYNTVVNQRPQPQRLAYYQGQDQVGVQNRPVPVLRPTVPGQASFPASYQRQQQIMNVGTGYTLPQNVPEATVVQPGLQIPQQHSPYSSSPQYSGSYPGSPAQQQGQYLPKSGDNGDPHNTNMLNLLNNSKSQGSPQADGGQVLYQNHPNQSPQQQQQQGYSNPQQYAETPPNLAYYPYHRDFLNSSTEVTNTYSVKLPSGAIHQYPAPDYGANSPPPPQVPLPDYPSANGYIDNGKLSNATVQNSSYIPQTSSSGDNITIYQQQSPISTNLSQAHQLPRYEDVPQGLDGYLDTPSASGQQSGQYLLTQMALKQDSPPKPQIPAQNNQGVYQGNLSVNDYGNYRNNTLDSPQGSPMPANSQVSPNVYKGPTGTPPTQRKTQPARQISNELYSNIGSPSNQLLLGDMSLNSPRPRSETIDMENPPLPPRSSTQAGDQATATSTTTTYYNSNNNDPNLMPPPTIIPPTRPSPATTANQPQTTNASPQLSTERRLRSGTVEMVDAAGSGRSVQQPQPPGAPSQRYLPTAQYNIPQRSRAGTVEMADGSLNPPERRYRSGTVEMTEDGGGGPPVLQAVPLPDQQQQYSNGYHKQSQRNDVDNKSTPQNNNNQSYAKVSPQPPPPYTNQSSQPPVAYSSNGSTIQPGVQIYSTPPLLQTSSAAPVNNKQQVTTSRQQTPTSYTPTQQLTDYNKSVSYSQPSATTPLQHQPPQQSPSQQSYNNQGYPQQQQDGKVYKQDVSTPNNGRTSLPPPGVQSSGMPSPGSQLSMENLKLSPQQQKGTSLVSPIKQEYDPSATSLQNQYSDQEINQQQKAMTQQYLQRVRQAQLQQQLREIQSEYENSLQVEQDIAQEFLREQHEYGDPYRRPNQQMPLPPQQQQGNYQPSSQQQAPPLQHAYQTQPQYMSQLPPHQNMPPTGARNYQDNNQQQQYPPHMLPNNGHPGQRIPYPNKDVPVFPVTGLPINQQQQHHMYHGQQPRMPYHQQQQQGMLPPQKVVPGSQPIVIMPGGGQFSNPGQFIPTSSHHPPGGGTGGQRPKPSPAGSQGQAGQSRSGRGSGNSGGNSSGGTPGTGGKQQTPFQKLRKIAEEISSFVDDVVKFTGKKGKTF